MSDLHDYIRRLFEYDAWANRAHVESLRAVPVSDRPADAMKALSHLLAARRIWYARVDPSRPTDAQFMAVLDLDACERLQDEANALWTAWFDSPAADGTALNEPREYRDSYGDLYRCRLADMLGQVVLHSAHHRGQVARAMRLAGLAPADADYYVSPMTKLPG